MVWGTALMPDHLVDGPVLGIGFGAVVEEVSSTSLPLFHLDMYKNGEGFRDQWQS